MAPADKKNMLAVQYSMPLDYHPFSDYYLCFSLGIPKHIGSC